MKKVILFATALAALVSCSSDDIVVENNNSPNLNPSPTPEAVQKAIVFSSGTSAITRADYSGNVAAGMLNNKFVVEGVKWDGGESTKQTVFDHYNVNYVDGTANTTTSNSAGWEYVGQAKHDHASIAAQSIKYWDYAKSQYDFIAYSAGLATANYTDTYDNTKVQFSKIDVTKLNGVDSNSDGKIDQGAYSIKGKASELAKVYIADMKTAFRTTDYQQTVQFKFRSLSAKVRVALYETVPGYSVKDVVFYTNASTVATDGKAHLFTTGGDVFNDEGAYVVYFPTTGNTASTDNNKAHLSFIPETSGTSMVKEFGTMDLTNTAQDKEVGEAAGKVYLGRASNEATYAGDNEGNHYTTVIPNETGAVLNLKVNYTLVSTDGSGEVINVTGATAKVPADFASWKSGYAYTYIFKISQNTNGFTNPSLGTAGLYPITFDAVVTETEEHVQETITTVATPSITTYSKGEVVTQNNEYKKNTNVYIVVENGTALTVNTNANMYKIVLEDEAAQTLNEASVANVLANGSKSGNTWTVIDAKGKSMTATYVGITAVTEIAAADSPNGNAITINGAVFNTGVAGIYAFEYIDTDSGNKYYKIIKIVN